MDTLRAQIAAMGEEIQFLKEFDKCLSIKFSYMEEYSGLNGVDRSSNVMVGKLYATDGTCNEDSRVSVSIERNLYFVRHQKGFILIKLLKLKSFSDHHS